MRELITQISSTARPLDSSRKSGVVVPHVLGSAEEPRSRRADLQLWSVLLVLLMTSGCVYRSLTVRTDPAGAKVYVDDALKGESPVTYDFLWYGTHRVIVRKDGYQRLDDQKNMRCPLYLWIPFDLALELIPFRISDVREWSYTLTPSAELPSPNPPALETVKDGLRALVPPAPAAPASESSAAPVSAAPAATVAPVVGMPESPSAGTTPSVHQTPPAKTATPAAGTSAASSTPESTDATR